MASRLQTGEVLPEMRRESTNPVRLESVGSCSLVDEACCDVKASTGYETLLAETQAAAASSDAMAVVAFIAFNLDDLVAGDDRIRWTMRVVKMCLAEARFWWFVLLCLCVT